MLEYTFLVNIIVEFVLIIDTFCIAMNSFDSFNCFIEWLLEYQSRNNVIFKMQRSHPLNEQFVQFKYKDATFACIRAGTSSSKTQARRTNKTGCSCQFKLIFDAHAKKLLLTQFNEKHNHQNDIVFYNKNKNTFSYNRRLADQNHQITKSPSHTQAKKNLVVVMPKNSQASLTSTFVLASINTANPTFLVTSDDHLSNPLHKPSQESCIEICSNPSTTEQQEEQCSNGSQQRAISSSSSKDTSNGDNSAERHDIAERQDNEE